MIRIEHISKSFRLYSSPSDRLKEILLRRSFHTDHQALNDISFYVRNGETLGIIGPNGAGKSTLLKILLGVYLPDNGTVEIDGKITGLLELGTGFNPEMTGLENIYMNGTLLGMTREELRSREQSIVAFSELGYFIKEPLKTYSSGMAMRLAFSIAIHADPRCFVVDEALSVGDAHFQQKCMGRIRQFRQNGGSIIFVSHDLNAVKMLCDSAILLHEGNVINRGTPEKIVNDYNYLLAQMNESGKVDLTRDDASGSYGNYKACITGVTIKGEESGGDVVSSGERVAISVEVQASENLDETTVGIIIRNKYGLDIYGTNTFHYGKDLQLDSGKKRTVTFCMNLNIAPGKYSIAAALHTTDTHEENCMHWLDGACDFEVAGIKGAPYIGCCRLEPVIEIVEH